MTTVCLTFDFDAVSLWLGSFRATTATPMSRGQYGADVGVPRVLTLLARHDIAATFFVPAHTAVSFPDALAAIRDGGHEIALHGDCHEAPVGRTETEEADLLDRSIEKLSQAVGGGFQPKGYRSPAFDLSENSIALLENRGLLYDSSMMGHDFLPYRARRGYVVDQERFEQGPVSSVIEMPVSWELDDFPYFTFLNKPLYAGLRTPREVLEIWRDEFDHCRTQERGVFTLTMHPQIIGRGPRIAMLDELITHMSGCQGVDFSTLASEAARQDATLPR
ncbi:MULTISPECIES: polysaccharide deacetylase family protein [Ponticoccus]|uniref:Chitooligosaccharide deacetylase n=1 Tax=Ponticoccus litoralis TaxID=422297 RepID=A0AAW9SPX3_9RHOB